MRAYYQVAKEAHPLTYTRAVQRGLIKGLATYNILQNPHYMQGFAISAQFAMEHQNLKSMKFISQKTEKRLQKQQKFMKANAPPPAVMKRYNSDVAREMLMNGEDIV